MSDTDTDTLFDEPELVPCRSCMFWAEHENKTVGECRRHPPSGVGWPVTKPLDFCGEGLGRDGQRPPFEHPLTLVLAELGEMMTDIVVALDGIKTALEASAAAAEEKTALQDAPRN